MFHGELGNHSLQEYLCMITLLDILIFAVPKTIAVYMYQLPLQATVNPLLSPLWNLFFPSTFCGGGGGGLKGEGGLI